MTKNKKKDTSFMGDSMLNVTVNVIEAIANYQMYYHETTDKQYVVESSIVGCNFGAYLTKIGVVKDHAVYDNNGNAVMTVDDCVAGENIYDFGICGSPHISPLSPVITISRNAPYGSGDAVTGHKCLFKLTPNWQGGDAQTYIWDSDKQQYTAVLLENGSLACSYGLGIVTIKEVNSATQNAIKVTVTLGQLLNSKVAWKFRDVTSYNLATSIPTYKNAGIGRAITQADVDEINRVIDLYEINLGVERVCHFLSQCHAETDAGFSPIERFNSNPLTEQKFKTYERSGNPLGNIPGSGDGYKYRGAGAMQLTGRTAYKIFSEYIGDPKVLSDGALYVGGKYFWEAAAFFWSVYKPNSNVYSIQNLPGNKWPIYKSQKSSHNKYDLNGLCDLGSSVWTISNIVYGNANDPNCNLQKRIDSYNYYKSVIK